MRDQKSRVSAPWVNAETAFTTYSLHVVLVENFEGQTEACFQLLLEVINNPAGINMRDLRPTV
jgi:hypothetical protein